jgi:hypothetical protein
MLAPDHLAPFLSLVSDDFGEVSGRDGKWNAAQVGKPYLHLGVCEHRIDLVVKPVDDLGGCAAGHPDTDRCTRLKARHIVAARECVAVVTGSAGSLPALTYSIVGGSLSSALAALPNAHDSLFVPMATHGQNYTVFRRSRQVVTRSFMACPPRTPAANAGAVVPVI